MAEAGRDKHIYLAADHNGFELKNVLREWLKGEGYTVTDMGPEQFDKSDDYPDFGIKVARAVAEDPATRLGILTCGTGVGMAVVADKVPGIRAGVLHDPELAASARRDDDVNILALGAQHLSTDDAKRVIEAWLATEFSGAERHRRRIEKIQQYESAGS